MKKFIFGIINVIIISNNYFAQSMPLAEVKKKFAKRAEAHVDTLCARFSGMNDGYFTRPEIDTLSKWLISKTYEKEVCYMSDSKYNKCKEGREVVGSIVKKGLYEMVGVKLEWMPAKWGYDEFGGWMESIIKTPDNTFKMLIVFCYTGINDFTIRSYSPYFTQFTTKELNRLTGN